MLSGEQGLRLFTHGIVVSIVLVIGSIIATILLGLLFYRLDRSNVPVVRWIGWAISTLCLNAPLILLLVLAYLIVSSFTTYSAAIAVMTAVLAIGLNNGASLGAALIAARATLPPTSSLRDAVNVGIVQIRACVIHAAKSSPVGAFIGAPELLTVLTDITSFSGERAVTFTMLALFYILIVQVVIVTSAWVATQLK